MAKRLQHEKKYTPYQCTQIGEDDDAASPFWLIKKQARERLYRQRPDLPHDEIEKRVNRILERGNRPCEQRSPQHRQPSSRRSR